MFKICLKTENFPVSWDIDLLLSITDRYGGVCLFTSAEDSTKGCNIIGIDPVHKFSSPEEIDAFLELNRSGSRIPLIIGYLAYDHKNKFEEEGLYSGISENIFPGFFFCLYRYYITADNSDRSSLKLTVLSYPSLHEGIGLSFDDHEPAALSNGKTVYSGTSMNKNEFAAGVIKIREYIKNGDIYQANLTRKITGITGLSALECAVRLKNSNPVEFGVFANIEGRYIISTSPERFFRVTDGRLLAYPIKGTSPRYDDALKDRKSLSDLKNSKKDIAELAMIVDLLRNDMNRICENVVVKGFPLVMELRNVFHLYSEITGDLKAGRFSEIIRALFPAGSITGCPKVRACQIIEELENAGRGPYTGNFGYMCPDGSMDFNIMIRTLFYDSGSISFNAGGGITLLSDPFEEYMETVHKTENIVKALNMEDISD